MTHDSYPDAYIRGILATCRTIAMVGASAKDNRPSYFAFKYLLERGYRMIPVNPGLAGGQILGQTVHARLTDIPEPVDMVDVFRAASAVPAVLDEMLTMTPRPAVLWLQLGVRDAASAARAESHGIKVVMDRCPKIEYGRLSSEIGWMGVNSRTLSSRRPPMPVRGVQRLSLDRVTLAGGTVAGRPREDETGA
jgi:predicted CoA-binding protein